MPIAVPYLKIVNYRSIHELELRDIPAFAVFAGANGSGKSNFFDALDFAHLVLRFDVKEALQRHSGWKNICGVKCEGQQAAIFSFEIDTSVAKFPNSLNGYQLKIEQLDTDLPSATYTVPLGNSNLKLELDELSKATKLLRDELLLLDELPDKLRDKLRDKQLDKRLDELRDKLRDQLRDKLRDQLRDELRDPFSDLKLYRFEPRSVKESNMATYDDSELQRYGQNIAAVLHRLEKDDEMRETITDWLQLIVPQLETVQTETERLTGNSQLAFREKGTDKLFPAHLISDGTIYLLCLLVAMLDRPKVGITLIEEPERGLHPKAIIELVQAFRERATIESPIWLTTHSETVVRMLKDNELWLVDKKDGKTQINPVRNIEGMQLNLDEAWLSNALNGGLPW